MYLYNSYSKLELCESNTLNSGENYPIWYSSTYLKLSERSCPAPRYGRTKHEVCLAIQKFDCLVMSGSIQPVLDFSLYCVIHICTLIYFLEYWKRPENCYIAKAVGQSDDYFFTNPWTFRNSRQINNKWCHSDRKSKKWFFCVQFINNC